VLAPWPSAMLIWLRRRRRDAATGPRRRKCSVDNKRAELEDRPYGGKRDLDPSTPSRGIRGQRLDRFLVSVLGDYSRSQIQKLIADGRVRVGTARCVQPSVHPATASS
jgi:23S rRNA-/tRNA-specific pseudouridylate synthase